MREIVLCSSDTCAKGQMAEGPVCFPGASHTGYDGYDCPGGHSMVRRMFLGREMDCVHRQCPAWL